jgi:transposase
LNSKLHAVCDQVGRPIILKLSAGQVSDHKGAAMVIDELPAASHLIADRGYDSAWFRQALSEKGITPCIPSSRSRKVPFVYDKIIYRQRHRIENLFAKLKDWRRIATRYDRCAHTFFAAICIAAAVFWL